MSTARIDIIGKPPTTLSISGNVARRREGGVQALDSPRTSTPHLAANALKSNEMPHCRMKCIPIPTSLAVGLRDAPGIETSDAQLVRQHWNPFRFDDNGSSVSYQLEPLQHFYIRGLRTRRCKTLPHVQGRQLANSRIKHSFGNET